MLKKNLFCFTFFLLFSLFLTGCVDSSKTPQLSALPKQVLSSIIPEETVDTSKMQSHESIYEQQTENGTTVYSTDQGKTWISKSSYEELYPPRTVEWWTYDDFAAYIEQQKVDLQKLADSHANGYTEKRGNFTWTTTLVDETIQKYEQQLSDIKNGIKISKNIDDLSDDCGYVSYSLDPIKSPVIGVAISLPDGTTKQFDGTDRISIYEDVKKFCEQQVVNGNLKQEQMDNILAGINK